VASTPTSIAGPWPRRSGSTWTWARARSPTAPALATRLKEGLAAIPAVRLVTPGDPDLSAGIVCLEVGGHNPGEAAAALRRHGILASVTPYADPYLRLGPSIVTSEEDVDAVVGALRALA
jgi:selenocysteine lyase/cysteine desulfurase